MCKVDVNKSYIYQIKHFPKNSTGHWFHNYWHPWCFTLCNYPGKDDSRETFQIISDVLLLACIPLLLPNTLMVFGHSVSYSSHNSNDIWQTQMPGLLCLVRAVFVSPFKRVCWNGGGILWFILRLCDPKMQPICNSYTVILALFISSLSLPGKFATIPTIPYSCTYSAKWSD